MADEGAGAEAAVRCDICDQPVCEADRRTVPGYVVAEAAEGGHCPANSPPLEEMAREQGRTVEDAWQQVVDACREEDWTVCLTCKTGLERGREKKLAQQVPTCWFCGRHHADSTCAIEKTLHKPLVPEDQDPFASLPSVLPYRTVHYHQTTVQVPRCPACERLHDYQTALRTWGCLPALGLPLAAILWFALTDPTNRVFHPAMVPLFLIFGVLPVVVPIGVLLTWFHMRRRFRAIKPAKAAASFPDVDDLVRDGWTLGPVPGQRQPAAAAGTVRPLKRGDTMVDMRSEAIGSPDRCRCPACDAEIDVRDNAIPMDESLYQEQPLLRFMGSRQVHLRCPRCRHTFLMMDDHA
jgi:hypothetical protein